MQEKRSASALVLGLFIFLGLSSLGYLLAQAALDYKAFERSVKVKGLSEREYPADIVIWPVQFTLADNNLSSLYKNIDANVEKVKNFLTTRGVKASAISISTPSITDKSAQQYGSQNRAEYRYTGVQTVTVYSDDIDTVRRAMSELSELGKQGIVLTGNNYGSQPDYLFTRLNEIKPAMVEEATQNAREVAQKFAADSDSTLGKIKNASQGQFSISPRDRNNPHIKKIRVVSTVEYYLSD